MKTEEANKIIAEYMGENLIVPVNINELSGSQKKIYQPYIYSLDALVPVWEKLGVDDMDLHPLRGECYIYWRGLGIKGKGETVQEAACIATAKAIKELK